MAFPALKPKDVACGAFLHRNSRMADLLDELAITPGSKGGCGDHHFGNWKFLQQGFHSAVVPRVAPAEDDAVEAIDPARSENAPALSLVPEALAPPNGCWPTTAPVGLSLT